jgi:NADH-quinone oxidoreductase subunit I
MKTTQPRITTVPRYGDSMRDRWYLPAILDGTRVTLRHLLGNLRDITALPTLEYPEEQPTDITTRYRGLHRLTHREDGSIRCVACFLCATACPAQCINIVATERQDGIDEKMPEIFTIDTLECVFCGMCVEACPTDAIRMDTGIFSVTGKNREDFLLHRDQLLAHKGAFGEEVSRA